MKNKYKEALKGFPEFLTIKQLVELGIYLSVNAVHKARHFKKAPPEMKISPRGIRFLKKDLIKWLEAKGDDGL